MIYSYSECIKRFGSHYALLLALKNKQIYKIKEGIYSDLEHPSELEIFIKTHRNFVFTMESAFYYLGISDVVPDKYCVATDRDATKFNLNKIKQYYFKKNLKNIGVIYISHHNVMINVYNKERMLIELIRYKRKIPFDYYKDVIRYYREHINEIDIPLLIDYINRFPKKDLIMEIIQAEVF